MIAHPIPPMVISVPSEAELKENIQEMQQYEREHPDQAPYFEQREAIFKRDLAVLEDPKNAGIDPNTRAGAENLLNQMEAATKDLTPKLDAFLQNDHSLCQYGWTMMTRHWISV